jgi:type IV fimbrial biogenesis protein FimT
MFEGDSPIVAVARLPAGFTLVELLVVMVVGAILLAIAVPALQGLFAANQLTTITDGFATALSEARSEAAKLNINVQLTPANGGVDWSGGWTMVVAGAAAPGMPSTLRTGAPVPAGYTLKSTASFNGGVTFDSTGRLSAGAPGEFVICQGPFPAAGGRAQMITVAASGRVRIAQNDASGNPLADDNTSVTTCTP